MALDFKKLAAENNDFLIETRRYLHRHPEVGSHEFNTNAFIKKHLDEWGIPYKEAGETSIVATIQGARPGKVIALRGDFDALPIEEATGLPFASENKGVMHACGHDFHATYMLGVTKILKDLKNDIAGTVKIIFQEGEEIGAGAREIIEAHLVDDVQNVVALHVWAEDRLGEWHLNYGIMSAHGSGAIIDIETKGGDRSHPESGRNALLVATDLETSFTSLLPQYVASDDQAVFVPTVVSVTDKSDGIPAKVHLELNFRTYDYEVAKVLDTVIDTIAQGVARIHDASIKVQHRQPSLSVVNDKESTDRAAAVIETLFGKGAAVWSRPNTGGENFSRFLEKIPGVYIHVGAISDGNFHAHHTNKTDFDERVLANGVAFLLAYVFTYLNE